MKTPWEAISDSITKMLSVVHEANQNSFSAALAFKLSLLKKHILSPDSHGRSGFKLSPYPDIVGIPFAVMSSSESIQRITRAVSSPMTQPPPWWCTRWPPRPRLTPTLTVSLSLFPQGVHSAEATRQGHWRGRGSHTWAECWVSNAAPVFHSRVKSRRPLVDSRAPYPIDSTYAIVWW